MYIYYIYIYYIYIYRLQDACDTKRHVLYLYFMTRKASYDTLLNMSFDAILIDLFLYILFTSVLIFVGLVPSCFREFKIFSRGYSVRPKCFLIGIFWVRNIFS